MRRLARHLFTLCAAVSMLACIAAGVLWMRSYEWAEGFRHTSVDGGSSRWYSAHRVESRSGWFQYSYQRAAATPGAPVPPAVKSFEVHAEPNALEDAAGYVPMAPGPGRDTVRRPRPGAEFRLDWWSRPGPGGTAREAAVQVPYAALALLGALLPGIWVAAFSRRARAGRPYRPPCCKRCGYDLRGSPLRCPECGTPATRVATRGP